MRKNAERALLLLVTVLSGLMLLKVLSVYGVRYFDIELPVRTGMPNNAYIYFDSDKLTYASPPCVHHFLTEYGAVYFASVRFNQLESMTPTGRRYERDEACDKWDGFDQPWGIVELLLGRSRWTKDGDWNW